MIVVIDTSVWVSALHFASRRGKPRQAVEIAAREHTVAICRSIEEEISDTLVEKFGWTGSSVTAAIKAMCPFPLRVELAGDLHVSRDPNDDMAVECAVQAGAQCIVTGDKDLLVLGVYRGIRIVTPAEYLAMSA